MHKTLSLARNILVCLLLCVQCSLGQNQSAESKAGKRKTKNNGQRQQVKDTDLPYPPKLPGDKTVVTDRSKSFLVPPESLRKGIKIAEQAPTVDFLFYPQQNYPGKPWSNWGDGCFAQGKYYSAIGDHYAVGRGESRHGTGTAFVYEYDPATKELKTLVNVSKFLDLPSGHYSPGKVHSRIDMGSDGWLYYATHRGSSRATSDANHYQGDWILRTHPGTQKTEVVAQAPVLKHCIPNSVLDPKRMIFYGGTAPGTDATKQEIQFFAYDTQKRKMIYSGNNGPARYMIFAQSTGKVYYVPGNSDGELFRFDPESGMPPKSTGATIGIRAATQETKSGKVYTVSNGQRSGDATVWQFDTRTEEVKKLGTVSVGTESYVASLDVDPSGRFLYFVPGAHGGGFRDGSPLVQFDISSGTKKVIAFLHPFFQSKYGLILKGTYSTAVSEKGDKVFITWNISRGTRAWDCCGLTVVHIPKSER